MFEKVVGIDGRAPLRFLTPFRIMQQLSTREILSMKTMFRALAVLMITASAPAVSETGHNHGAPIGAHIHGHSTLNIAIEDNQIEMELEAPGSDIVGFEHAATSEADKLKLKAAKTDLSAPLKLFTLSSGAVCKATSIDVHYTKDNDEADHAGHDHGAAHKDDNKGDEHGEFHATYKFSCANTSALSAIRFGYFKVFAGVTELKVNIITPKGQKSLNLDRDEAAIDLSDLI